MEMEGEKCGTMEVDTEHFADDHSNGDSTPLASSSSMKSLPVQELTLRLEEEERKEQSQESDDVNKMNKSNSSNMLTVEDPKKSKGNSRSPSTESSPRPIFRKVSLSRSNSVKSGTESESSNCSSLNSSPKSVGSLKKFRTMDRSQNTQSGSEFDEDETEELELDRKITVGICAMNKKTYSRPMKEILNRLHQVFILDFQVFPDELILNEPIEDWPIVDCLISFYSKGFPLEKAIKYAELRNPFLLNDLQMQYLLMDRRKVYELLVKNGIEVPRFTILNRDRGVNSDGNDGLIEHDDGIEVNGELFMKPFVEKPVSAEDHNIYIYYPFSAGGGCQILFRKIGSRSSVYSSESRVRMSGSYVYEEFLRTAGTDVKVYTVGEEYAHAEARKSPALDGKVERDAQGKEVRYPVILSAAEKLIAKKVCTIFKQRVCGFDLLRTNGRSYVCDVNGFSFVKTSQKYYDDCSQILVDIILQNLAPQLWIPSPLDHRLTSSQREEAPVSTTAGTMLELRCVVGIIRHGDRTPKQKMKMIVQHQKFFDLFNKYGGPEEGKLKLKKPKQLQEILDITRELLSALSKGGNGPIHENPAKLLQMKSVLEMYGYFSGINRKVQLKSLHDKRNIDIRSKFKGRNTNSGSPYSNPSKPSLLLIVKWGGELTPMGKKQAEELGRAFRCMYPGGQGEYGTIPGCGFLRLHSTYRHDLKVYSSDEGRVQMTAAAFAKGLLALEGELTPILVHLVKSDRYVTGMLDTNSPECALDMQRVKSELHEIMHKESDFTEEDILKLAPTKASSLTEAIREVRNPHEKCQQVYDLVQSLVSQIRRHCDGESDIDANAPTLYHEESLRLMLHRWHKLEKDFLMSDGKFDISLIPDIYDCVKYDYLHNGSLGLKNLPELYHATKALADIVIPQEYGLTKEEKLSIAKQTCHRLMKKIKSDLKHMVDPVETTHRLDPRYSKDVVTPHRHVRTRLYFTSESHVHSMLGALRFGGLFKDVNNEQWNRANEYISEVSELSYLTQIVILQYEDPMADAHADNRYHIELYFSPGVKTPDEIMRMSHKEKVKYNVTVNIPEKRSSKQAETVKKNREHPRRQSAPKLNFPQEIKIQRYPFIEDQSLPVTVLQYNKILQQSMRLSPPSRKEMGSHFSPSYIPKYSLRTLPKNYAAASKSQTKINKEAGKSSSTESVHISTSAPSIPTALRNSPIVSIVDSEVSIAGWDRVETLPSLHPLISLHSSINVQQMEQFFDEFITSELEDSMDLSQVNMQPDTRQISVPLFLESQPVK